MATSESKGRFFLQNESIRIDSNRELECSTSRRLAPRVLFYIIVTPAGGLVSRASRHDPTRGHSPQCCSSSATSACSIEMIGNGFLHPQSFSFTFPSLNSCFRFHGFPIVLFPSIPKHAQQNNKV